MYFLSNDKRQIRTTEWYGAQTSYLIKAISKLYLRRVWRYQIGNQNPYIEEEHTTQWPSENVQKNTQRSTKYTHKTKDRVTRTPLKQGVNSDAIPTTLVTPVVLN